MKLILIIPSLNPGGAERVLSILANYWANAGHTVAFVTYDDGGDPPFYRLDPRVIRRALHIGAPRRTKFKSAWNFLKRIRMLRREVRAFSPDVVVSFMEITNVTSLLATLGMKVPVVVAERTDPFVYRPGRAWDFLRWSTYGMADAIVTQTESVAKYFRPRHNARLSVIPNPVQYPPRETNGEKLPVPGPVIVSIGKLTRIKGYDLLVDAFARLAAYRSGWQLVIYGTGEERARLIRRARASGVGGRVHFPGRTWDSHAILRQATLYVSSSRFEGFPNALCEAMACGLPVIATDCPSGPRTIITDGVDGLLVPNEDASALAVALDKLMSDPELRRRLGENAASISSRLSVEKVAAQWEGLLHLIQVPR